MPRKVVVNQPKAILKVQRRRRPRKQKQPQRYVWHNGSDEDTAYLEGSKLVIVSKKPVKSES